MNDLLPPALDYHRLAMPISLLCRSIEFSLVISFLQLFLSTVAIYASLKGKRILFIICFNFIIVLITFGGLFLILLVIIIVKKLVLKSTFTLFLILYQDDDEFCLVIEPVLQCRQYDIVPTQEINNIFTLITPNEDIIERKCGTRSTNIVENENDCIEYLTNVTLYYKWIIHLSIMYFLFLIIIIVQLLRFISCKSSKKNFWKLIKNTKDTSQSVEDEEIEENNSLVIKKSDNQNSNAQEFEMITIFLNDRPYNSDENVDYL